MKVVGAILAGGLSRRMKGPEKSLLRLADKPIIEHVTNRLAQQVGPIIVNANGDPTRFDWLKLPVIEDTIEGFAGPLAGVLASLLWADRTSDAKHILTVAADTPFFPLNYAQEMLREYPEGSIRLAMSNGTRHPVFGLWPVALAAPLEAFLRNGDRKVMLFVEQYANEMIEFSGHDPDPFFNINTPDDLQLAETFAGTT